MGLHAYDEHGLCFECDKPRKPMHKNQVVHTRTLRAKMQAEGMKQITVWIPADKAEELKALAEKWRIETSAKPARIDK